MVKSQAADVKVNGHIPSSVVEVVHRGSQEIRPPGKANDLSVFKTKQTSGRHFQIERLLIGACQNSGFWI